MLIAQVSALMKIKDVMEVMPSELWNMLKILDRPFKVNILTQPKQEINVCFKLENIDLLELLKDMDVKKSNI